jgi:hypothetical protein
MIVSRSSLAIGHAFLMLMGLIVLGLIVPAAV